MRQTHTYALLPVSKAAYEEIKARLLAAGYDHAVEEDGDRELNLYGLAIVEEDA